MSRLVARMANTKKKRKHTSATLPMAGTVWNSALTTTLMPLARLATLRGRRARRARRALRQQRHAAVSAHHCALEHRHTPRACCNTSKAQFSAWLEDWAGKVVIMTECTIVG
jgi:hypothetical protein